MNKLILALLLGASATASAQTRESPFAVKESGQAFSRLQQAVDSIGGGSGTIVIAPGTYRDCAVQQAGGISFVAATPGAVTVRGGIC